MREGLRAYLVMANGIGELTKAGALAAAKALVSRGEVTADQVSLLAEDLLSQARQNHEAVTALVSFEVDRTLGLVGLATADEVSQLTERIHELEKQLRELKSPVAKSPAAGGPTRKTTVGALNTPAAKASPTKRAAQNPRSASGTTLAAES